MENLVAPKCIRKSRLHSAGHYVHASMRKSDIYLCNHSVFMDQLVPVFVTERDIKGSVILRYIYSVNKFAWLH